MFAVFLMRNEHVLRYAYTNQDPNAGYHERSTKENSCPLIVIPPSLHKLPLLHILRQKLHKLRSQPSIRLHPIILKVLKRTIRKSLRAAEINPNYSIRSRLDCHVPRIGVTVEDMHILDLLYDFLKGRSAVFRVGREI